MAVLNETIEIALRHYSAQTAKCFQNDVLSFMGGIKQEYIGPFRAHIENLARNKDKTANLVFLIYTPGGVVETVEQMVRIMRQYYNEIWFVVPDMAMSAGTILCMSGDKIYMDYSSFLGPIDPQVFNNEGQLVPALGYLDHVELLISKSANGTLTDAEFAILQNQDLATLRRYELAKDLSINLLREWLVQFKFKDWDTHNSNGEEVTQEEKVDRAKEIGEALVDHNRWHSHGRSIGLKTLSSELKLKIEDYTDDLELRTSIRQYSDLLMDCAQSRQVDHMFHTISYSAAIEC